MDCNLDVVRGLACLFDPEGIREARLMAVHLKLNCHAGETSSIDVKPPHYERTINIK
jgi:hypothetical protein